MGTDEFKQAANNFYTEALQMLSNNNIQYLVGGAFALRQHAGIFRETKDLDIFCKAGEYPRILKLLAQQGYRTEITDSRWIAKAFKDEHYIDIIFSTPNNLCPVDDSWYDHSANGELFGVQVKLLSAEELFWCKIYVQNKDNFSGADVNHIILKRGKDLDWKRVLMRLEQHWHLLLAQFLNFQFVYPSQRDAVPKWLFDELLRRCAEQYELPVPVEHVCRGPLINHSEYNVDITEWGYKIITVKTL
jgi:hypothetical protein